MASLKLSCPCGATFDYNGTESYLASRSREWQTDHLGHAAPVVATKFEELARASALDVATVADLVKETTAKINEWFDRELTGDLHRICGNGIATLPVGPKRGTHVDVELQPGETITIRGREHPDHDPLIVLHGRLVTEAQPEDNVLGVLPTHLRLDHRYAVTFRDEV